MSGEVRGKLVIGLLVLSHGVALWLGMHRHAETPPAAGQGQAKTTTPASSLASLVEKGRALAAEDESGEDEPDFRSQVDAARGKFPANADLRAILEKGVASPFADFSAETIAAFGTWLERDPAASLHWFSGFYREYGYSEFVEELKSHFQRAGATSLQAWIAAEPQIRSCLMECAAKSFGEQDGGRALQVAASLTSASDRAEFLKNAFSKISMAGQLSSIRALLDRDGALEFLDDITGAGNAGLLDEVRGAGFPEAALRRFEEEVSKEPEGKIGRNNIDAVLNNPNRAGQNFAIQRSDVADWTDISPYRTNVDSPVSNLNIGGPPDFAGELHARREQLAEGRLTVADFAAWLESAGPPHPEREREILATVAAMGLDKDPRATLDYLQQADPEGWAQVVATRAEWQKLPPELLAELARQIPETDPTGSGHASLLRSCIKWYGKDPQACMEAVQAYPSGPLKDRLLKIGVEKEESE